MNLDFWAARWGQQRIGFHLKDINPKLLSHGPRWFDLTSWESSLPLAGHRILVPLCGKALDLRWLAGLGATVTGVEFVEQAARAFFAEQELDFAEHPWPQGKLFVCTSSDLNLRILVTDFFALKPSDLGPLDAVYDRAALVAVEPRMRTRYADPLARLCPARTRLLMITFDHDSGSGPPFSVPQRELSSLFVETFALTLLEDSDLLLTEPQFRQRGATHCREQVWLGRRL
jgi:thiopurine S-methyltransferase